VPSANALFQSLFQMGSIVGPALAGLLLAGAGVRLVYWLNVATFLLSVLCVLTMRPQPPSHGAGRPGLKSVLEGLRFVRRSQQVQGAYLIDINAMVFGLPRALFPASRRPPSAAARRPWDCCTPRPVPGADRRGDDRMGIPDPTAGPGRHRRGHRVGAAITGFGVVPWLWAALPLLAVAGWADVISAVFRNTIIQFSGPDKLRGRLMGCKSPSWPAAPGSAT